MVKCRAGVSILAALCGFVIGGPSPPLPFPPLRSRGLRSRTPVIQLGGLGERCQFNFSWVWRVDMTSRKHWGSAVSSPSGVWGEAPAEIEFGAF